MGGADRGSPQLKGCEQVLIRCDDSNGSMRHAAYVEKAEEV